MAGGRLGPDMDHALDHVVPVRGLEVEVAQIPPPPTAETRVPDHLLPLRAVTVTTVRVCNILVVRK